MNAQAWWQQAAAEINEESRSQAWNHQSQLTKPGGALGKLEKLATDIAAWQGQVRPEIRAPHCVVFAADHGVVAQGVSAFPQAVTVEMLKNFVAGGAAISVLAQHNHFELSVINCGTAIPCEQLQGIIHKPVAAGTADFSQEPAMTSEQAAQALQTGADIVDELKLSQCDLFIAGEMGIGNTSAASCMSALLLQQDVVCLVGPGTGVQGHALDHKAKVLGQSIERAQVNYSQPLDALLEVGGFEIAAICGAYIRAAQQGIPVLVDGFIATSAALLAVKLNPSVREWMLFSHGSAEPGHQSLLAGLNAEPLLDLGMRLGEGSGAGVAIALVQQALALHNKMATFAEASVSGAES